MNLDLVRFLALTLSPSIAAAARPGLTFVAIQILCAVLVHTDAVTIAPSLAWLVSLPALVVAAVFAVLETASRHDPEVAAVLRDLHVDKITGAFGAFSAALLFSALGLRETEVAALAGAVEPGGLLEATSTAAATEHTTAVEVGAIGGAVVINGGLTWLRGELLEFLDSFELGRVWAYLETGGVAAALLLLPLLPLVAAAFLVAFAIGLVVIALLARAARRWADSRDRVPCGHCDFRVRPEASLCPRCQTEREPTALLDQSPGGLGAAWRVLRKDRAAG